MGTCELEGCERQVVARGVCHPHYCELRKTGKLALLTAEDRLWRQVDKAAPGGCWLWTGKLNHDGYVRVRFKNKCYYGHRLIYELLVGPIPEGLELDHLCRNRACVNPEHVEPVTHEENVRRGVGGINMAIKTHCPQGHPLAGDNLYLYRGYRACRTCRSDADVRFKARRRVG